MTFRTRNVPETIAVCCITCWLYKKCDPPCSGYKFFIYFFSQLNESDLDRRLKISKNKNNLLLFDSYDTPKATPKNFAQFTRTQGEVKRRREIFFPKNTGNIRASSKNCRVVKCFIMAAGFQSCIRRFYQSPPQSFFRVNRIPGSKKKP